MKHPLLEYRVVNDKLQHTYSAHHGQAQLLLHCLHQMRLEMGVRAERAAVVTPVNIDPVVIVDQLVNIAVEVL